MSVYGSSFFTAWVCLQLAALFIAMTVHQILRFVVLFFQTILNICAKRTCRHLDCCCPIWGCTISVYLTGVTIIISAYPSDLCLLLALLGNF